MLREQRRRLSPPPPPPLPRRQGCCGATQRAHRPACVRGGAGVLAIEEELGRGGGGGDTPLSCDWQVRSSSVLNVRPRRFPLIQRLREGTSPEHCPSCFSSSRTSTSSWSSSTSSEDDPSRSSLILPAARASAAFCPPLIRKPSPTARSEGSVPPLLVRTACLLSLLFEGLAGSSTGCSTRSPARSPHKAKPGAGGDEEEARGARTGGAGA